MRSILTIFISLFLAACAYSSDVVKIGPDKYYVTGTAGSERGGEFGAKQVAIKEAGEFCSSLGKQVEVTNVNTATINNIGTGSADVIFKCIP